MPEWTTGYSWHKAQIIMKNTSLDVGDVNDQDCNVQISLHYFWVRTQAILKKGDNASNQHFGMMLILCVFYFKVKVNCFVWFNYVVVFISCNAELYTWLVRWPAWEGGIFSGVCLYWLMHFWVNWISNGLLMFIIAKKLRWTSASPNLGHWCSIKKIGCCSGNVMVRQLFPLCCHLR